MQNIQVKSKETEAFEALHHQVKTLENGTRIAIEDLEERLRTMEVSALYEADPWSSTLDTVEVYTMENTPTLKESVRQISGDQTYAV